MSGVFAAVLACVAGAALAALMDWLYFERLMRGMVAVWAREDDFAYGNYLIPRVFAVALGGAVIGLGVSLDNRPAVLAGGLVFLVSHVAIYVMVIRDSNRSS